ncbi:hypothetical protein KAI04_03630 [Candidatus Pacearchaeota archaeon]|nr:hypothetical protein [Candidatus Pacearchaeota archaeon]
MIDLIDKFIKKRNILRDKKEIKNFEKIGDYNSAAIKTEEMGYVRNAMILYAKSSEKDSHGPGKNPDTGYIKAGWLAEKNGLIQKALEYYEKAGDLTGTYYCAESFLKRNNMPKEAFEFAKKSAGKNTLLENSLPKEAVELNLSETALKLYIKWNCFEETLKVCDEFGMIKEKYEFLKNNKKKLIDFKEEKNEEYRAYLRSDIWIYLIHEALGGGARKLENPKKYFKRLKGEVLEVLIPKDFSEIKKRLNIENSEINLRKLEFYKNN